MADVGTQNRTGSALESRRNTALFRNATTRKKRKMQSMQVIRSVSEMQEVSAALRTAGKTIALVPTMGCLHEGHMSLVSIARDRANRATTGDAGNRPAADGAVIVSIFVNPTQFGPGEDFARYPRTENADLAACENAGADIVFLPDASEMFPPDFSTFVEERERSRGLCGEFRPGHFRGVATVVLLLFNIVRPDIAVFGQKDAQQAAVLRKMRDDLRLPVALEIAPVSREADGLARSSRNRYLAPAERTVAPQLFAALNAGASAARAGANATGIRAAVAAHLAQFPQFRPQYIALVDADTMRPLNDDGNSGNNGDATSTAGGGSEREREGRRLLAVAAHLGPTRLIDNIVF